MNPYLVTDDFIITDCFIVIDYRDHISKLSFSSKVICKNSSTTIWEILFNTAIPIVHHQLYSNGGFVITMERL